MNKHLLRKFKLALREKKPIRSLVVLSIFETSCILRTRENTRPRFHDSKLFFKVISDENEEKVTIYQDPKLKAACFAFPTISEDKIQSKM